MRKSSAPSGRTIDIYSSVFDQLAKFEAVRYLDTPIKLASGRESRVYVSCRSAFSMNHRLMFGICEMLRRKFLCRPGLLDKQICLIGVPESGTKFASAISVLDYRGLVATEPERIFFLEMRRTPKPHGSMSGRWVEKYPGPGFRYVLLEDVRTTGGSLERARAGLAEDGFDPTAIEAYTIFDRSGENNPNALFLLQDVIWAFGQRGYWPKAQVEAALRDLAGNG